MQMEVPKHDGLGYMRDKQTMELSARNCEERCCDSGFDAWMASEDKWYCEDCLLDYWADEVASIIGWDETETGTFIAATDDADEFTHFVWVQAHQEITLNELETARAFLR